MSKLDDDPALNDYATPVIKTIETLKKKGKKYNTLRSVFYTLRELNRNIDLMNPKAVKLYIADLKNDDQTKQKKANNYDYFVKENGLFWEKPRYRWDTKVPITPTKEQTEAIISAPVSQSSQRSASLMLPPRTFQRTLALRNFKSLHSYALETKNKLLINQ